MRNTVAMLVVKFPLSLDLIAPVFIELLETQAYPAAVRGSN